MIQFYANCLRLESNLHQWQKGAQKTLVYVIKADDKSVVDIIQKTDNFFENNMGYSYKINKSEINSYDNK